MLETTATKLAAMQESAMKKTMTAVTVATLALMTKYCQQNLHDMMSDKVLMLRKIMIKTKPKTRSRSRTSSITRATIRT